MPRVDVGSIRLRTAHLEASVAAPLRRTALKTAVNVGSNAVRIDDVQGQRSNEVRAFRFDDPSCAHRGGVPGESKRLLTCR